MGNGEFYEQALVPEHLTKMTIENLPLDEAFYISPGERDDYEPPAVFVGPDRKLRISRSHNIDVDDNSPMVPLELVGVMRVALINPVTSSVTEHCIADLRFIEWHSLMDTSELSRTVTDQEDYMSFVDMINDALAVDGFIALDQDEEFEANKKIPSGTFYGPEDLHEHLGTLQKRGNKIMNRFLKRRVGVTPKDAKDQSKADTSTNQEQSKKPAQDLSVKFNRPSS